MNELQHPEHNDNCLDQSILIARRDNELPADEVAQVEQHIATCGDCAANDRLITSGGGGGYSLLSPFDLPTGGAPDPFADDAHRLTTHPRANTLIKSAPPF